MFVRASRLRAAQAEIETLRERLVARMEENFDQQVEIEALCNQGKAIYAALKPLVQPGPRTRAEREAGQAALNGWSF